MKKVTTVDNMRKSDEFTISKGALGIELMGRAAMGIYNSTTWEGKTAIVTGSGNNGGDGFALADILYKNGFRCDIFNITQKISNDSKFYYDKCKNNGIKVELFNENTDLRKYDRVVDCIFGTGFKGTPEGIALTAIKQINNAKYIISCDINSGLNGDSGKAQQAVKSDLTVSIGYYKTGHFLNDAKDYILNLKNVEIGIELMEKPYYLIEKEDLKEIFIPRKHNTHKGTYGKNALIGGSLMYSGAIKLAAMSSAALKIGTGLSILVIPDIIANSVLPYILESTVYPLPSQNGFIKYDEQALKNALVGVNSIAVGMGLGQGEDNMKIIRYILENYDFPIVIDADGINTLSQNDLSIIKGKNVILTPHVKEFSRLTKVETKDIIQNPVYYTKEFAKKYNVIVLLKGTATVITDGMDVYITDTGTQGMAKGGSGDVLSGIIAGINAFSDQSLLLNVAAAAFINGKAAELAEKEKNTFSMTANDTVNNIYKAINEIIKE